VCRLRTTNRNTDPVTLVEYPTSDYPGSSSSSEDAKSTNFGRKSKVLIIRGFENVRIGMFRPAFHQFHGSIEARASAYFTRE